MNPNEKPKPQSTSPGWIDSMLDKESTQPNKPVIQISRIAVERAKNDSNPNRTSPNPSQSSFASSHDPLPKPIRNSQNKLVDYPDEVTQSEMKSLEDIHLAASSHLDTRIRTSPEDPASFTYNDIDGQQEIHQIRYEAEMLKQQQQIYHQTSAQSNQKSVDEAIRNVQQHNQTTIQSAEHTHINVDNPAFATNQVASKDDMRAELNIERLKRQNNYHTNVHARRRDSFLGHIEQLEKEIYDDESLDDDTPATQATQPEETGTFIEQQVEDTLAGLAYPDRCHVNFDNITQRTEEDRIKASEAINSSSGLYDTLGRDEAQVLSELTNRSLDSIVRDDIDLSERMKKAQRLIPKHRVLGKTYTQDERACSTDYYGYYGYGDIVKHLRYIFKDNFGISMTAVDGRIVFRMYVHDDETNKNVSVTVSVVNVPVIMKTDILSRDLPSLAQMMADDKTLPLLPDIITDIKYSIKPLFKESEYLPVVIKMSNLIHRQLKLVSWFLLTGERSPELLLIPKKPSGRLNRIFAPTARHMQENPHLLEYDLCLMPSIADKTEDGSPMFELTPISKRGMKEVKRERSMKYPPYRPEEIPACLSFYEGRNIKCFVAEGSVEHPYRIAFKSEDFLVTKHIVDIAQEELEEAKSKYADIWQAKDVIILANIYSSSDMSEWPSEDSNIALNMAAQLDLEHRLSTYRQNLLFDIKDSSPQTHSSPVNLQRPNNSHPEQLKASIRVQTPFVAQSTIDHLTGPKFPTVNQSAIPKSDAPEGRPSHDEYEIELAIDAEKDADEMSDV